MIIIDEQADSKLIQTLNTPSAFHDGYCLHSRPATGETAAWRAALIGAAQRYIPKSCAYICTSGEIFLIAESALLKDLHKVMIDAAAAMDIQPIDRVGALYELASQSRSVLRLLEQKIETVHQAQEQLQKQRSEEQAARKRREILHTAKKDMGDIGARRQQRVLPELMIIEDDPFSRRLVENVLGKQYHLTALESAEDALAIYARIAPDLLLLDINLPDVTGHELLEKIIEIDPEAYVVMLSGNADRNNIMQAMGRGAKGFVAKPFARDKLFQYIERCPSFKESHHAYKH